MKITKTRKLKDLQEIVALSKNRGFVFQSSEIYGGLSSCWDYGPLGSVMKQNVKKEWIKSMTKNPEIFQLDAAILMHPLVWKASGHVDGFSDPMVDCKDCKNRFRSDNCESYLTDKSCPQCKSKNLSEERRFNLMFKTQMGAVEDSSTQIYLRPETAQGHFVNFLNYQKTTRSKIPFGIAAVGKSFRNEITPGNFIFRTREFEQMEMQYFVEPSTDMDWFNQWKERRLNFYLKLGISQDNLQFFPHPPTELAHYAKAAEDIQYRFPMGFSELEGIHNRTNFDLTAHSKMSGKKIEYVNPESGQKFVPYVIETAVGCDRLLLAFLCEAFREETLVNDKGEEDSRTVLGLHPRIAPVKVAILPLMKKDEIVNIAKQIYSELIEDMEIQYDDSSTIGKRYRRQDEIGTPWCVTVDPESVNDKKVTVRHRDTMEQERIEIFKLAEYFRNELKK